MSRAFVREDRDEDLPPVTFPLPPIDHPAYAHAAAHALLEAAAAGITASAEEATGYRWGDRELRDAVLAILHDEEAREEAAQDRRLIHVARRFLRQPPR